ncbi:MAG TPA: ribonuclease Y, partial [Phycisphaerales bacterium]|nr:ribonuclease Y [Phycisphaerales bacterium]
MLTQLFARSSDTTAAAFDIAAPWDAILIVLGLGFGALAGVTIHVIVTRKNITSARIEGERILEEAKKEAEANTSRMELESEKKATSLRQALDEESREAKAEIKRNQDRVSKREDVIDKRFADLDKRESKIEGREKELEKSLKKAESHLQELTKTRQDFQEKLSAVSEMTREDAVEAYMDEIREDSAHEANHLSRQILEEAEHNAQSQAREITLMAIQRFAAENVSESTVRSVKIPSDDLKGRVIGREGRNIRAIEKSTGADILVDDTPGVISVSCFDPIRRTIAADALQKLVTDGRVHPSRIEELVSQSKRDVEERIRKAGKDAIVETNIRGLHGKIVEAMGKLHFRTSYGQNVLRHSIEVAYIAQVIADQLGLDGNIARRAGFLHDIGKAMDHDIEGGHPAIGMEFAKKFGETSEEVLNAIGGHHNDIPSTTPYTPIVMAADAVSGARPGARRESMELYVKRLEQLEGIARSHDPVREAYAVQAGR